MSRDWPGSGQRAEVRREVTAVLHDAWREPGFCVPNHDVYPHQWLWDSCFHAVVWARLGSDRAVAEVANALANQGADGFVPHLTYWHHPDLHADFWGRSGASTITQPPMYGHALAQAARAGLPVPPEVVERARAGLAHLAARPRTPAGLVPVFHPWETGCDDSARWDDHFPTPLADDTKAVRAQRRETKGELVAALHLGDEGHAIGSDRFVVGSVGFSALVAWNARELASISEPSAADELVGLADELRGAVAARWRDDRWVDDRPPGPAGRPRGDEAAGAAAAAHTLDGLLPLLVDPRPEVVDQLTDPQAFGGPYGPRGAHRNEPTYRPDGYWRGAAWPQLSYLLLVAAEGAGGRGAARLLATRLVDGARRSGYAEYWDPETGDGLGAIPQTWATLALPALDRL